MDQSFQSILFDEDDPQQVAEFLRLTLGLLKKQEISANPVNYDLFYTYVAGKNTALNEKLDEFLEGEKDWNHEEAKKLFQRFFYSQTECVLEDIRDELLRIVAHSLGSLIDIAGKTSVSNISLQHHVDKLAAASKPEDVLASVSMILNEARAFVTQSQKLEEELTDSSREISNLKSELENARNDAMTDALTGLYNRRGFNRAIGDIAPKCQNTKDCFTLMLVDLDYFKSINDNYGHLVGDKVLAAFAKTLRHNTRIEDYLARFGGEEFVIIMPGISLEQAKQMAEKIRKATMKLSLKVVPSNEWISNLTVSLGVAQYRNGETVESVIDRCDQALYAAKDSGRNCVMIN